MQISLLQRRKRGAAWCAKLNVSTNLRAAVKVDFERERGMVYHCAFIESDQCLRTVDRDSPASIQFRGNIAGTNHTFLEKNAAAPVARFSDGPGLGHSNWHITAGSHFLKKAGGQVCHRVRI